MAAKRSYLSALCNPSEMLNSTLMPTEVSRWQFNELMDYSGQARRGWRPQTPAEIIAAHEPILAEAQRLAAEYKAAFVAHPSCWVSYSEGESDAKMKNYNKLKAQAYTQAVHANKLRTSYSHLLAQSIWWDKVAAKEAERQAKREAYDAAVKAHLEEQPSFENAQVEAAIAIMPALPEAIQKRLRTLLKWAIYRASRGQARSATKRRVMRGLPLVEVGALPHPPLPKPDYTFYNHAF